MVASLSLLYVTFPDKQEALQMARVLLEKRFIACANILDSVTSVYPWEGQPYTHIVKSLTFSSTSPILNS